MENISMRLNRMNVETAGNSSGTVELSLTCVEDMENFRAAIFAAKKNLQGPNGPGPTLGLALPGSLSGGNYGGSKDPEAVPMMAEHSSKTLATLERIERLLEKGIAEAIKK